MEFPRLFRLAKYKNRVVEIYLKNGGLNYDNWEEYFVRPLLDREVDLLNQLIEEAGSIVLVPEIEDRLTWVHDSIGYFSFKRLSELLINEGGYDVSFAFDKMWKLKVPPKVRNFLWMLVINRIPTKDFLIRRGVQLQQTKNGCSWCDRDLEQSDHLFFKCKFMEFFWQKIFNGGR